MSPIATTRRTFTALSLALVATGARAASSGPADLRFATLAKRYLDEFAAGSPVQATALGDHRFDTQVDNLSSAARVQRTVQSRALLAEASALKAAELSRENQVDLALLVNQLNFDIWTSEVLQSWAWDPQIYANTVGGALYSLMTRDFAPLAVRMHAAMARMEKLPALLAQGRAELQPARVPLVHAQTVARQNPGVITIVDQMITPHAGVLIPAEQARLAAATKALRAALAEHQTWLDTVLVPNAKGDFRLGAALYDQKLAFALMSPLPRAEIRTRAEAALKTARAQMYAVSQKVLAGKPGAPEAPDQPTSAQQQAVIEAALELAYVDHPPRDKLVEAARAALDDATAFVKAKDLITLPDAPVRVITMPEFQRGAAVAFCDAPGPLERNLPTFYNISPVLDDWTATQAESFLREYNRRALNDVAIHEAMPGHFVQLWHANKHPSILRAVLASGPFIEGWAVYAEDMVAQAGYMDPLFRLQQLKTRVRTITNAILDQMVHVDGAGREEVMTFLTVTAFQQEREADGKWVRACLSSAQLPTYFVGVSEHDELRAEAEKRWGAAFKLKRYNDTVLSFGSPPVRFARALMFDEPIA
jgi:uncharacterized protein (DUF885 family)